MGALQRLCIVPAAWLALAAASALADEAPPAGAASLQLSFASPVQLVPESRDVSGLRLTLFYGKNAGVSGLDIAALGFSQARTFDGAQLSFFGNAVEGKTTGLQAGLFANATGQLSGMQVGGILANFAREGGRGVQLGVSNFSGGKFSGVQIGLIGSAFRTDWTTLDFAGVQIGVLNLVNGDVSGVQIGALNGQGIKEGKLSGVQIGAVNFAGECKGLQIGVFNSCRDMRGVQIGLLNHIAQGAIPWLPIVNAKF
ncbi:MAG TPA: hypothetical protein VMI74_08800 [Burkholderiales bacterium]|nr:hypothetical protein [Burkholderiales bacterium]